MNVPPTNDQQLGKSTTAVLGSELLMMMVVLMLGASTPPASAAVSKAAKACKIVTAGDLKTLTGSVVAVVGGANVDGGSTCSYSGKGGLVSLSYFEDIPENDKVGLLTVMGKNRAIAGVRGASVWLADTKSSLLVRKGNKTIQLSMFGSTAKSDAAIKSFTTAVAARI